MTEVTGTIRTADAMASFGERLAAELRASDVIVLTGPLGAGKTTLVRGLGEALGVRGTVASPTFVIARTHPSLGHGPALIHVDAYRLNSALELDDLDLDFEVSVTVIEWGADFVSAIADSWLEVVIDRPRAGDTAADEDPDSEDAPREIVLRATGTRWEGIDLKSLLPL